MPRSVSSVASAPGAIPAAVSVAAEARRTGRRAEPASHRGAILETTGVDHRLMGGHNDLALAGRGGSLRGHRGELLRGAVPLHEGVDFLVEVGQGGDAQVEVELLGEAHEHVAVREGRRRAGLAEGAQAAFPVDVGAVLLDCGSDRQDDIRAIGDLRGSNLEGHEEGNLFEGFAHGGGLVEVADVNTADDQSLELTGSSSLDHLLGVEATGGKLAPTQGLRTGLVETATEGKQAREEAGLDGGAVTGAARDPHEAGARALGQSDDGGEQAGGLRGALTHKMMPPDSASATSA